MSFIPPILKSKTDQAEVVFEKSYREPSSVKKEGASTKDGNSSIRFRRPAVKDTARFMRVPITNDMAINKEGQIVKVQYIPGAPTIFVEDHLDAQKNPVKGLRSLGYNLREEYTRTLTTYMQKLAFNEQGYLFLNTLPNDPNLVYFLSTHSFNQDWEFNKKPVLLGMRFKQYKREELNRKDMDMLNVKKDWMQFLFELQYKENDGYKYNEVRIAAISKMIGIDGIVTETGDRFAAIYNMIDKNLKSFVQTYQPAMDETKMDIGNAVKLGIVAINEKEAKLIDNKKPSLICNFEKGQGDTEGLAFYLWGAKEGPAVYQRINDLVTTAQMEITARS